MQCKNSARYKALENSVITGFTLGKLHTIHNCNNRNIQWLFYFVDKFWISICNNTSGCFPETHNQWYIGPVT